MRLPGSEVIYLALQVVARHKGRSLLTVLGLAIGVGAFIAMVSFGQGARTSVIAQFERIGTNLLRVRVSGRVDPKPHRPLTDGDLQALTRETTTLLDIVPLRRKYDDVALGGVSYRVYITGTTPGYAVLHDQDVVSGGMFDELDLSQRAKVCVLGQTPARALFGDRNPLGATITIGGTLPCRVLGLIAPIGMSIDGILHVTGRLDPAIMGNPIWRDVSYISFAQSQFHDRCLSLNTGVVRPSLRKTSTTSRKNS